MHAIGDSRNSTAQINKQAPRTWTKVFTSVKKKLAIIGEEVSHIKTQQSVPYYLMWDVNTL
jgi:uncharacterized protein with HEPN domain